MSFEICMKYGKSKLPGKSLGKNQFTYPMRDSHTMQIIEPACNLENEQLNVLVTQPLRSNNII